MSKLTDQWIELFRAGDHGEKGAFTEADLDQMVANYQPQSVHEAPVTIGHPRGDAPAFGWMGSLKRVGSVLLGKLSSADPAFEEMVEKKSFKKRSIGLVKDAYGQQGWGLHHVAFLGAQAPHIKGLADCKFEDDDAQVVEVEFQENQMANESKDGVIAWLNAWFEEKFGSKSVQVPATPAAKTFSEDDVKRIASEAVAEAIKPLQTALDTQKTQFAERETKIVTAETQSRADAAISKLRASGRWVPAFDKIGLPIVFAELAKTVEPVEFGEGSEKKSVTPLDALVAFMEQQPKIVPDGNIYRGQSTSTTGTSATLKFSESSARADRNSVDLTILAKARAEKDKISFAEALPLTLAENPHLAIPGGAAAGLV